MYEAVDFVGRWRLFRSIDDRHGQQSGTFEGVAAFKRVAPGVLDYHEAGKMQFGGKGQMFTAERQYTWRFAGDGVAVTFADGAAFHQFNPVDTGPGTSHLCGEDMYDVTYDFRAWPAWTATWKVVGPRKEYTSVSHYTRG